MGVLVGLLGAILGVGLFIAGFYFGKGAYTPKQMVLTEDDNREREKLIAEQDAFKTIMSYNSDTAYQIGATDK